MCRHSRAIVSPQESEPAGDPDEESRRAHIFDSRSPALDQTLGLTAEGTGGTADGGAGTGIVGVVASAGTGGGGGVVAGAEVSSGLAVAGAAAGAAGAAAGAVGAGAE